VLEVYEQVEETKKMLAVIVEPIRGSLADVYDPAGHTNTRTAAEPALQAPQPSSRGACAPAAAAVASNKSAVELPSQFEVALGAYHVATALGVIHSRANLLHLDISPHVRARGRLTRRN